MAKSDEHIYLGRIALVWLENKATQRGLRGCEEVILKEGYVADSAAISGLQFRNEKTYCGEHWEERIGSGYGIADDYSFVFESKVSRGDFFGTFKHCKHIGDRFNPIANFHFVVTPKGMVKPEEVPTFWGLLERSGSGLRVSKMPEYQKQLLPSLHEFAYKILRSSEFRKYTLYSAMTDQMRALVQQEFQLQTPQP